MEYRQGRGPALLCILRNSDIGTRLDYLCFLQSSFPAYTVLFHEASCLSLLEAILYHRDSVEALEDAGTDLTDYCVR